MKSINKEIISKITFVNQTLGMGGAETFNADLLSALQNNHGIHITAFTTSSQFAKLLSQQSIHSEKIPVVIDIIGNWRGLLKSIVLWPFAFFYYGFIAWSQRRTQLVLLSGFPEKIFFSPWAKVFNIPIFWIEFSPLSSVLEKFFRIPKFLYLQVKDIPDAIIVPTEYAKKALLSEVHFQENKVRVIPCGRSLRTFPDNPPNDSMKKIVCVSRFEKGKGQEKLLYAFQEILKEFPQARLQFVGDGEYLPYVEDLSKALSIHDHVDFLGYVHDVYDVLKSATACVFPSQWALEGFGVVIIEAMSLGKPVVAFRHGPIPEIIVDTVNGLLAESGNTHDLAKKILLMLQNHQLAQRLGEKGRSDFLEKYQMSHIAKRYYDEFLFRA